MKQSSPLSAAELAARAEDYARFAEESPDAACRGQLAGIARSYRAAAVIASLAISTGADGRPRNLSKCKEADSVLPQTNPAMVRKPSY